MTYQDALQQARDQIGPYCKACPVCNGRACRNQIPGPDAKALVAKLGAELSDTNLQ